MTNNFCPYKGLQPYTEADRAYFFGRERDQEIIASNLYAAPLTVLYGASGVGKSSVLMAGVVPSLRQTPRLAVVVFRTWQSQGFGAALKTEVLNAVRAARPEIHVDAALPLDEFLLQCANALRGNIFMIFDQFEEYFLYNSPSSAADGFDAEFARAVNRREVAANFLLALREDSLSQLDRFKGRIPNLLSNMLRLEHLDHDAAASAIRNPLRQYNQQLPAGQAPITIEDALVETVIDQVRTGQVSLGTTRHGQTRDGGSDAGDTRHIETPYLQLVMTRLWEEERQANSNTLRLATLRRLGGAERIVRTHLDTTMATLTNHERAVAARAFRYLVTPSGTKIAYSASDLANYAGVPSAELAPVLMKLAAPELRVLRAIAPPEGTEQKPRYEIFHDVLAPAVLDWRERYLQQARTRRLVYVGAGLGSIVGVIIIGLLALTLTTGQQSAQIVQQAQVRQATTQAQAVAASTKAAQAQATSQVQATQVLELEQVALGATATPALTATATLIHTATRPLPSIPTAQVTAATTQFPGASPVPTTVPPTPTPPVAIATIGTAKATLNVRDGPDTSAQLLGVVKRGDVLNLIGRTGDSKWFEINFPLGASTTAWVIASLVDTTALVENLPVINFVEPIVTPLHLAASCMAMDVPFRDRIAQDNFANTKLGCPIEQVIPVRTGQQIFQRGLMLYRPDTRQIYVVFSSPVKWLLYNDTWSTAEPPGPFFTPTPGLVEPILGFGKVWREQLGGPDSDLGWAIAQGYDVDSLWERFENGYVFFSSNSTLKVFIADGTWKGL